MMIPNEVPWCLAGEELGSGGQGVVYPVTRKGDPDGCKFALKTLRNADSTQAKSRFIREIEAIKKINHPVIIRVVDHSEDDAEFQFYVMEYHEGAELLADIIYSQPTNPFYGDVLKSLDLFEQIVSAISACENNNPRIVHRDINPKNILLLRDGSIRLIDFGICHFEDGEMITFTDEDVGTRNYTPPECTSWGNSNFDFRSDLYSASKVLWAAITARRVFDREEPVFSDNSMKSRFPDKTETWHLAYIFEKSIRREPSDRFSTTGEALAVLHEVRRKIEGGFPPLEVVNSHCPSCGGLGTFDDFPDAGRQFGPIDSRNFSAQHCTHCGFVVLRSYKKLKEKLKEMENLR